MPFTAVAALVLGLIVTVVGCVTWRSVGKRLTLVGGILVTYAAGVLLGSNAILMDTARALLACLIVVNVAASPPGVWRQVRIEVLLAAATILAMVASSVVTGVSGAIQTALLVLVVVTAIAFIGSMVFHGVPRLVRRTKPNSADG